MCVVLGYMCHMRRRIHARQPHVDFFPPVLVCLCVCAPACVRVCVCLCVCTYMHRSAEEERR